MRITLVGADYEENLGLCMIGAAVEAAGHRVEVLPFNDAGQTDAIVERICSRPPEVVGLGIQFQHRAHEFMTLASRLRARGYRGHVTCGGQFPTMAFHQVLGGRTGVDSIVLHEGEQTTVDLLEALDRDGPLSDVRGLAIRDEGGRPVRTAPRRLVENLDELHFARRYRPHTSHLGIPFVPMSGGRGCWGKCSYCSITTLYRDARAYGGAKMLRHRAPENVAAEMAMLSHAAGGPAIFCFHDDNFLLPRPRDSLSRVRAIRAALDSYGVGNVAMIAKCRPDSMTVDLAKQLRELGVIRVYIGVENASQRGSDHLNRQTQTPRVREALRAVREAGIFACYNLLLFEPDATIDDVKENVAFIREHSAHPVNFCRAEPYHGTPLHRALEERDGLGGSYLGWDYRIVDDRAELLFRICASAFRGRNFAPNGVANRYMGLGYSAKLLEHFYPDSGERAALIRRAGELTQDIALETADLLEEAIGIAENANLDDRDGIERDTALLGLKIAAFDRVWLVALDALREDMEAFVESASRERRKSSPPRKLIQAVQQMTVAGCIAATALGCGGSSEGGSGKHRTDGGRDGFVADPPPPDAGVDVVVVDPPPPDAGVDVVVVDPPPPDAGVDVVVVDPPPPDAGLDSVVVDMVPPDAGFDHVADPPPADAGLEVDSGKDAKLIDQWRDTTPKRAVRSDDLPFFDPPSVIVVAKRDGDRIRATLSGGPDAISTRWQSDGAIEGDGREVAWEPASPDDQLRVAVRSRGGVSIATLRASEVEPAGSLES